MANTPRQQTKKELAMVLNKLNFVNIITDPSMIRRVNLLKQPEVDSAFQGFFKAVCTGHFEIDDANVNAFKTIFLADILDENDPTRVISEGVKDAFRDFKEKAIVARLRSLALFTCMYRKRESDVKPKIVELFHFDVRRAMDAFFRMAEIKHSVLRLKYASALKKGLTVLSNTRCAGEDSSSQLDATMLDKRRTLVKNMKIIVGMYEKNGGSVEDFADWEKKYLGRTIEEELAADVA